jgi:hypothetical protein
MQKFCAPGRPGDQILYGRPSVPNPLGAQNFKVAPRFSENLPRKDFLKNLNTYLNMQINKTFALFSKKSGIVRAAYCCFLTN